MEPSALIVRRACSLLTASRKGTQQKKAFYAVTGRRWRGGVPPMVSRCCWKLARDKYPGQGIGTGKGFSSASQRHLLGGQRSQEQVGRKVHGASALALVSLKGPVVEETEDASRKTEVVCWLLPEQCWRTALLPGRVAVCVLQLSLCYLRPTRDLLMCWACIKAEVFKNTEY